MFKKLIPVICFTLLTISAAAQTYTKTSSGLTAKVGAVNIELQVFSPSVIRVIKSPVNENYQKQSLSVIAKPQPTKFTVTKDNSLLVLTTSALKISLDTQTGSIQYQTPAGKLLMAEQVKGADFNPVKDLDKNTYQIAQRFTLPAGDAIYGLGQHQEGVMNYRGHTVLLKQKNTDIAVPFLLSSGGYGLFWDNYSATTFKDDKGTTSLSSEIGDGIDYYFIAGGNADGVIAGMRMLTGNAPMFAKWVFGFWQSRERYTSQQQLIGVVKKYRDLQVPLDGIVQDWQYWGTDYDVWNATAFGNPLFPDPKKMTDSVHQLNAHMIISVWPSFGAKTAIYQEMKAKGFLYDFKTWPESPNVAVYDAFNLAARDVYWKHINKNLFSIGIDGWWLDATEPEQPNPAQSDSTKTFIGSFKAVRNAYPLVTTGGIYEHQRKVTSDKRVFILTRSAFAGQQRNATMTWSGDIQSTWEVLRKQISGGLNLSLSGIPYWNTDIGGFFTARYPKGNHDPAFREIYTRWFEFGTFTPMMRSHGTGTPREIFNFGKKGDVFYDSQEKFINLRYSLLPYIYSTAWQVTAHSSTMMRALVMDFPGDTKVYNINNEYLFGKAILVAPVTDSLYTSKVNGETAVDFSIIKTHKVYLPAGSDWVNFWSGESHKGGFDVICSAPIDEIPLFVKAGSIIPFGPKEQYAMENKTGTINLKIYPGANGNFILYEDENDNYNYEQKQYSTIELNWNDKAKTLTIGNRNGSFKGMIINRHFNITLVKPSQGMTKTVSYSGKQLRVTVE